MGSTETQESNTQAQKENYIIDLHRKEQENLAPPQNFQMARNLVGSMTTARPVQGNLFSILEEEDKQRKEEAEDYKRRSKALMEAGNVTEAEKLLEMAKRCERNLLETAQDLYEQGKLLSIISDGIQAGAVGKKLIVFIARELYRQAQLFGGIDILAEHAAQAGMAITSKTVKNEDGSNVLMKYPVIHISLGEAAKWIKGANNSTNRNDVYDVLKRLDSTITFIQSHDSKRRRKKRVLSIEDEYINDDTGQKEVLIMLRPIFFESIGTAYVTGSERSNRLLPTLKKEIEVNLYLYVLELLSMRHEKGYPTIRRVKEKADQRIIPFGYIAHSHKNRSVADFNQAVEKLVKGEMLTEKGVTIETANNGYTLYYVFHLNPGYNDTTDSSTAQSLLPPH